MSIVDFYTMIVNSFGLTVTEEGYIKNGDVTMAINKKPLAMPMKNIIKTIMVPDNTGKLVADKVIFNPLKENPVKGDSLSLNRLKLLGTMNASGTLITLSNSLLELASVNDLKDAPLEISSFLVSLASARGKAKVLVDDSSIKSWGNIMGKAMTSENTYPIKIFLKKGVKLRGEKYNRGMVISSPLLEKFKDDDFLDVNLRPKDKKVFILLMEYILDMMIEEPVISITNNSSSPGLVAMLKGYKKLMDDLNGKLEVMKFMDSSIMDDVIEISYTYDQVGNIDEFTSDLAMIPDISDNGEMSTQMNSVASVIQDTLANANNTAPLQPMMPQQQVQQEPVTNDDALFDKLLYGDNLPPSNAMAVAPTQSYGQQIMNTAPTYYQQQPMMPQQQQPYGNSYPMQQQQPMYPQQMDPRLQTQQMQSPYAGGGNPAFGSMVRPTMPRNSINRMY